jgi:hypothetical protein
MADLPPRLSQVDLVDELSHLRRGGITRIRAMQLPLLEQAASYLHGNGQPSSVERLVRQAANGLGGGPLAKAASLMYGFEPGTRGSTPTVLRELAADACDVLPGTFRRQREKHIYELLAEQIRALVAQQSVQPTTDRLPSERSERLIWLVEQIAELSAAELGQFAPMLAERLGVPRDNVWRRS